jgi:D-xylose transport system substrate-binding protein
MIVMINNAPIDNNAKLFKQGAHSVFDPLVSAGKLKIGAVYDTPDWSPDQAQNEIWQIMEVCLHPHLPGRTLPD